MTTIDEGRFLDLLTEKLIDLDDRCLNYCKEGMTCNTCLLNTIIQRLISKFPEKTDEGVDRMGEVVSLAQYKNERMPVFTTSLSGSRTYHLYENCPRLQNALYYTLVSIGDLKKYSPNVRVCKTCGRE